MPRSVTQVYDRLMVRRCGIRASFSRSESLTHADVRSTLTMLPPESRPSWPWMSSTQASALNSDKFCRRRPSDWDEDGKQQQEDAAHQLRLRLGKAESRSQMIRQPS